MKRLIALLTTLVACTAIDYMGSEGSPVPLPQLKTFSVSHPYYEKGMLVYLNSEGRLEVSLQPFTTPLATFDEMTFNNLNMEEVDATVLRACAYDGTNIRVIDIIRGGDDNTEITFVKRFGNVAVRNPIVNGWSYPNGWTYKRSLFYLADQTVFWYSLETNELQGSYRLESFYFNTHIHPYTEESVWIINANKVTAYKFNSGTLEVTLRSMYSDVPEASNDVVRRVGHTDGLLFVLMHYSPEINIIDTTAGSLSQQSGTTITIPRGCTSMDASDSIAYLGCENLGAVMIDATGSTPVIKEIIYNPMYTNADYILKIFDDTVLMTDRETGKFSIYSNPMDGTSQKPITTSVADVIPNYRYEYPQYFHLAIPGGRNQIVTTDGSSIWSYRTSRLQFSPFSSEAFSAAPGYVSQSFYNSTSDELYMISYSGSKNHFTVFEKASELHTTVGISRKYTTDILPRFGIVAYGGQYIVSEKTSSLMEIFDASFQRAEYVYSVGHIESQPVTGCSTLRPIAVIKRDLCFYLTCSDVWVANFSNIQSIEQTRLADIRPSSETDAITVTEDTSGNVWLVYVGKAISLRQYNTSTKSLSLKGFISADQLTFPHQARASKVFYLPESKNIVVVYSFGMVAVVAHTDSFELFLKESWYTTGTIVDAKLSGEFLFTYQNYPAVVGEFNLSSALAPAAATPAPTPPTQQLVSVRLNLVGHSPSDCPNVIEKTPRFLQHAKTSFGLDLVDATFTLECTNSTITVQFSIQVLSDNNLLFSTEISAFELLLIGDSTIPTLEVDDQRIIELPGSASGVVVSFTCLVICVLMSLLM